MTFKKILYESVLKDPYNFSRKYSKITKKYEMELPLSALSDHHRVFSPVSVQLAIWEYYCS